MKFMNHVTATLLLAGLAVVGAAAQDLKDDGSQTAPQGIEQSPDKLNQLVAPIALYSDSLIAQILSGATYPEEILDASKWIEQHTELAGTELAGQVDQQAWDPAVKALTQFPAVLKNMGQNLAWTSELGDAYLNQQQDVMQAIQTMRQQAKQAGNLQSTDQEKVRTDGSDIVIEPATTDVVYVPQYDPWSVYGYPLAPFPGWYGYPGLYLSGPGIGWGLGFNIGYFGGFGWGWRHWRYDWHHQGRILQGRSPYLSHSRTIVRRGDFGGRGPGITRGGSGFNRGLDRGPAVRGGLNARPGTGTHTNAFSGFNRGVDTRMHGFRGQSSMGGFGGGGGARGGGGFRGGGGGGRGGGGRR